MVPIDSDDGMDKEYDSSMPYANVFSDASLMNNDMPISVLYDGLPFPSGRCLNINLEYRSNAELIMSDSMFAVNLKLDAFTFRFNEFDTAYSRGSGQIFG